MPVSDSNCCVCGFSFQPEPESSRPRPPPPRPRRAFRHESRHHPDAVHDHYHHHIPDLLHHGRVDGRAEDLEAPEMVQLRQKGLVAVVRAHGVGKRASRQAVQYHSRRAEPAMGDLPREQ